MIDVADSNAVYYYHHDVLGSVVALSDSFGNSCQSYEYSIYGQVAASDPNFIANPYMYTGRRFDFETGLYYYRARYYNPYIGRFLQTDPIGYDAGMNLYRYCMNNPLNMTDPSGCTTIPHPGHYEPNEAVNEPVDPTPKYEWEPGKEATDARRKSCKLIKAIASLIGMGKRAAIGVEAGWCNRTTRICLVWCATDADEYIDKCEKSCMAEHVACLRRAAKGKCQLKFKIVGY